MAPLRSGEEPFTHRDGVEASPKDETGAAGPQHSTRALKGNRPTQAEVQRGYQDVETDQGRDEGKGAA